jgi:hypothetical protein
MTAPQLTKKERFKHGTNASTFVGVGTSPAVLNLFPAATQKPGADPGFLAGRGPTPGADPEVWLTDNVLTEGIL